MDDRAPAETPAGEDSPDDLRALAAAAPAQGLRVGGFVPFTTTDYPDALSAVVFCQGCPWHCGYCHNPHLIGARGEREMDWRAILRWLRTRRGLLDAVVFSGGEPTAQPEIAAAIAAVRELGFLVGLHTGGAYPRRLARILPDLDWVGIDVKAPAAHYAHVTGIAGSGLTALSSLDAVLRSAVPYEVRTTVHPALTPPAALGRLAQELAARGVMRWVLQPFRATGCADAAVVGAAPQGAVIERALVERLSAHVPVIEIRA